LTHKKENRLLGKGKNVLVALNGKTWEPVELPLEFRQKIQRFEGSSLKELWHSQEK
jgi:acyl-CoA thioesterase FadM